MAILPIPIANWLQQWKISQYIASTDLANANAFSGGSETARLPGLLWLVGNSVQWQYNNQNEDPNLVNIGNFLKQLIGQYTTYAQSIITGSTTGTLPSLIGPNNETTAVGTPVVFSLAGVSGTQPITYQWYRNGVIIPAATGITYTLTNPQLSDSGSTFYVSGTNSVGTAFSQTATLTVTQTISGFLYYSPNDPGPTLQANSDPFVYQENYTITHNAPISVPIPSAAALNQFLVFKVPSTESAKSTWFNTSFNSGQIPDSVFQTSLTFGGFTYYYTRHVVSMDSTQPVVLT